ncbi:HNH endonuclease signature motif containing protein [Nocardioides daphniae]|uniref:HNH endonuclease n=1 Tax=Nocardioides daphniae TaxID=402297 RepID=A0A4V1CW85_9ACTN|nr:HNH endonuclease signature motif containing protein [Nocardioides daphniae]QCC76387.1 HNH endonuclease [Nocardioides daphniae]
MHPVSAVAASISSSLKSVADVNPTFMSTDEKASALLTLLEVESRAAELRLRVMAAAGDVAQGEGFRSIETWLAHHGHVRRGDAAADLRLAEALDRDLPALAGALREGRTNLPQARVIAHAMAELPDGIEQAVVAQAEAELVRLSQEHDPRDLVALGRRILELVDPDRFEQAERRRLEQAERYAVERQRLRLRAVGDGTTRLSALLPDAVAARLATYLHAFTNPRLTDSEDRTSGRRAVSHPRRLAEAFGQLLETLDPRRLPIHGGDATNLTVTISFEALRTGLGVATLGSGVPGDGYDTITAAQARRLACNARIIPAVLGTDSEVLDLGRASRLFSKAQRRALLLRDTTCRAEGCDIPGTWAEAHHLVPWGEGGASDLDNAALLCSHHHHLAHDPGYDMSRMANGDLRFHRRR